MSLCALVQWCVGADPKLADNVTDYAPFYSNPKCLGLVQNTVSTFLNRTNTGAPCAALDAGSALAPWMRSAHVFHSTKEHSTRYQGPIAL